MKKEDTDLEPIAIVGMACRLPGAVASASSLWDMLKNKGSGQTPKVPKSRFNIDAHYHENLERPGSFNVLGGYFLDGLLEDFDPTFFNITPVEAMWMDPQQRKMLEVSYEALESAGLSLESVAGSNTAVFVGSFTSDYQQMSIKDVDFRHNYAATGVDPGIISNRIGNALNLAGPSFTINTACSSSIYAIHNACHALRARDCEAAIAGGVNLILTVDQHMNTAKLGILSPTSTCHTFDASADGYGRAEGAGALYLKRLSDAIRDGDPVRGVIRSSAVNTNGKVAGMGITHPSVAGQERVVRQAYKRANLDPSRTAYLECHGTGTPVGDPIEVRAVSKAMNDTRSLDKPLLIGAIKANIGHSEAASGIFAVMKAALMTENAIIPGVAGLKNLNPAILEKDWNVKVNADTKAWPSDGLARRAGVSSFGYGGTNGHVIVEEVTSLYPCYQHGKSKAEAPYDHSTTQPLLVTFSAHDKTTLMRNIEAHAKVVDKYFLADLAYTLNTKRTRFAHRAFNVIREGPEPTVLEPTSVKFGVASKEEPDLAFVFTGQGAQWAGMGVEAMQNFPSFLKTIQELDRVLAGLPTPPTWTLESAILASPKASKMNDAEIAQPVTTAIQIAIVELFALWQVRPTVTVGHSSGEIAAAYAAGFISAPEAIIAAFYRGYAVKNNAPVGSMLAAGLSAQEAGTYLADCGSKEVVVACENSPTSVTLSGTELGIEEVKKRLDADKIFARELKTGKAYHSPQMEAVAPVYDGLLTKALLGQEASRLKWRQPRARWISSVTGEEYEGDQVPAEYWSRNLRSRVLFNSAITTLVKNPEFANVKCMVEVGPHSALAGPLKQIWKANKFTGLTYIPTWLRNTDSSQTLVETGGNLWVQNYSVDLEAVNAPVESVPRVRGIQKGFSPLILVDLPPYQWNYSKVFQTEPRFSHEQRQIKYGRHDILGSKVVGLSDRSPVWRNMLRHKDVPWLKDHKLGNDAVFPAAGHLSLAVEAVRQVCETEGIAFHGAKFRDVAIKTALVIPEAEDGIEVHFRLHRMKNKDQSSWFSFAVESITDARWTTHCEGTVLALQDSPDQPRAVTSPVDTSRLTQHVPSRRWYDAFSRVGFEYGPSFQRLGPIQTDRKYNEAAAEVEVETESRLMQGESRYILHPSTIDACLQLIIISINAGLHKKMPHGVVPVNIEELSLWFPGDEAKSTGSAVAWTDKQSGRYFNTHTKLMTKSGKLILDVTSLRCVAYEAAVPQQMVAARPREPYMEAVWKPDFTTLTASKLPSLSLSGESIWDEAANIIELIHHKKPLERATFVGCSVELLQSILLRMPSEAAITILDRSAETPEATMLSFQPDARVTTRVLEGDSLGSEEAPPEAQDLVFVGDTFAGWESSELLGSLKSLLVDSGRLLSLTKFESIDIMEKGLFSAGFSAAELQSSSTTTRLSSYNPTPYLNGFVTAAESIALVTQDPESPQCRELAQSLTGTDRAVDVVDLSTFSASKGQKVVIYDAMGLILSSLTADSFEALKTILLSGASILWVTYGVNDGKNVHGSMAQGFLRAIRSEQASVTITLLDVDTDSDPTDISGAVISKLKVSATKDSGADTEFWLHGGTLQVSRIQPNVSLNQDLGGNKKPASIVPLTPGTSLQATLVDGELVFSPDFLEQQDLAAGDVEVQVKAAEFELPQEGFPRVVTGQVLKVGSGVSSTLVGQEIVTYAAGSYSTIIHIPNSLVVPIGSSAAEDLVVSLPAISKVWNSMVTSAKATSGDFLLLLPTSLVTISLVAAFAQNMGIKLAVVVDTKQQRDALAPQKAAFEALLLASERDAILDLLSSSLGGSKPNVVLAYEFSELSQDVWRVMPPQGRFILSDTSIDVAPDFLPFARGVSFTSTGIESLFKQNPETLGQVLTSSVNILTQFSDVLLKTASKIAVGSLKDSTEIAQAKSTENAVITYSYETDTIKAHQSTSAVLRLDAKATYLMVGCLGGLGRSLTTRMMERGATSFAFISRSGADKPEAAQVIENIKKAGFDAQVFRADASETAEVIKVVKAVSEKRPIRGVVHAAMVLQDTMFERMTYSKFNAAVFPKVRGAESLHTALADTQLDFFVMTSSISATLGNPGQTNYCAANSFLDNLAWQRNLNGLPAVSLVLPMILDVGVVAENGDIETSLARKAMYGIDEREMLRGFEVAMLQPTPTPATATSGRAQIILGLEPACLAAALSPDDAADAYWLGDTRLALLCTTVKAIQGSGRGQKSDGNFASQLKSALAEGPDDAIQAIAMHIMQRCSRILMIAVEDFSVDGQAIADYGLDSMIGAELRNWLFKEFELDISFQHLLAPTVTFKKLAHIVAGWLGGILPEESA